MEVAQKILDQPARTKREVNHIVTEAHKAVTAKVHELTAGISHRWKEQFNIIKKENDDWQAALKQAHRDVDQLIEEQKLDIYEGLQR